MATSTAPPRWVCGQRGRADLAFPLAPEPLIADWLAEPTSRAKPLIME